MKEKLTESAQKAMTMENTLRDFGVKPVKSLLAEKEKYMAVERIHGKSVDRDLSR